MNSKKIIAFVGDLFFGTRIESLAQKHRVQVIIIEQYNQLIHLIAEDMSQSVSYAELVAAALVGWVDYHQPDLLIFDFDDPHLPWEDWISWLKLSPRTNSIPILAFGPHVHVDGQAAAKRAGANYIVANSGLERKITTILGELSTKKD